MYNPTEIIFVPESRCNLSCSHCFVDHDKESINIDRALNFIKEAAAASIEKVGYSGGEPFLRPEFLYKTVEAAIDRDLTFDRVMTNGLWYRSEEMLIETLTKLYDAGFDGRIGLSFDSWHNQPPKAIAIFAKALFSIWEDREVLEITAVTYPDPQKQSKTVELHRELATLLGGELIVESGISKEIRFNNRLNQTVVSSQSYDSVKIGWIEYTACDSSDPNFWKAESWFKEDFCEGPGHVLYIHGNGNIGACCGYANEEEELLIGNINRESFEEILENARKNPFLSIVYERGLSSEVEKLKMEGHSFPGNGICGNNCQFCHYLIQLRKKG